MNAQDAGSAIGDFVREAASAYQLSSAALSTRTLRRYLAWFIFGIAATVVFCLGILQGASSGWNLQHAEVVGRHGPLRGGPWHAAGTHHQRRETRTKLEPQSVHIRNKSMSNLPILDALSFQRLESVVKNWGRTEPNLTSVQITRSIRNHTIHSICQAEQLNDISMLDAAAREALTHQIIVDDERRFLYCYVPKVACSNWKRVIKFMQGTLGDIGAKIKMDHKNGLVFLDSFSKKEIQYRLRNYFKFMFVRNPVERLLSAFRNKFGEEALSQYKQRYAPRIIHRYRGSWDGKDTNITLEEFIRYLLDTRTTKMDQHWKPMHLLCQPCAVQYDFVGSFEQLSEDANYVLGKIKGDTGAYFPPRQGWYNPTTQEKVEALIGAVNPIYIQQYVDKYILDFITFGYAPPKQYYLKYHRNDEGKETTSEDDIDPRVSDDS